ncbi:TlpA family protein disulfide reductase [SAR202 cluster bacterium AD-802-E10_MRT_200m]|nr:TlpA family protein disulfide reductase [SAR202 cluster bacterium AD-802-E10_MRT_200m]
MSDRIKFWILKLLMLFIFLVSVSCEKRISESQMYPQSAPIGSEQMAEAYDFDIVLYEGKEFFEGATEVSISMVRGKHIILNFWAPLCAPCRAEMPELEAFWQDSRSDNWIVIGVDLGRLTGLGGIDDAMGFLEQIEITYPTGYTNAKDILERYSVFGMPTTIFINKEGRVVRSWVGVINREKLIELSSKITE